LNILRAVMVVGLQFTSWKRNGVSNSYRLSSVIERIKGDREDTCVTASRGPAASGIGHQAVANRMDTADSGTHPLGGSCTARISPYIRI
jgi:hypothetical protein